MPDLDIIQTASFWSIWYWFMMVMSWSMTSHWILGVPYDLVQRADREGGEAEAMVDQSVAISVGRIVYYVDRGGVAISAVAGFILAAVATAGFWYKVEFFQALFMLMAPHFFVMFLAVRLALHLRQHPLTGKPLRRRLYLRRVLTQLIGMVATVAAAAVAIYNHYVSVNTSFY